VNVPAKFIFKNLRQLLFSKFALLFLNGFLIATLLYFYLEDSYEKRLFEALACHVKTQTDSNSTQIDILLKSVQVTCYLVETRRGFFKDQKFSSIKSSLFHPVTYDLMTANNECGSYTFVLSRLLSELHISNRIAQMKVDGKYGGHILLEAETSDGWVVLDPSYNLHFRRPDGKLAGFADVQDNWNYYKNQLPAHYNSTYRYEGVRYTNWQKVPVLMPLMEYTVGLFIGKEKADYFSLRVFLLRMFHVLFIGTMVVWFLVLILTIKKFKEKFRMHG
jgi:hypothetical protein